MRATVHEPFKNYLKGSVGLFAAVAPKGMDIKTLSPADLEALAEHAFERYFESGGLFGTPESCVPMVTRLKQIGVTELACLIDFGIPTDTVLASLPYLDDLRRRCAVAAAPGDQSVDALIRRHGVTHSAVHAVDGPHADRRSQDGAGPGGAGADACGRRSVERAARR